MPGLRSAGTSDATAQNSTVPDLASASVRPTAAESTPSPRPWRVVALAPLALTGMAISGYLTWVHFSGGLALCSGAGGCEQVQASRFASVGGVPVALLGLVAYLGLLILGG